MHKPAQNTNQPLLLYKIYCFLYVHKQEGKYDNNKHFKKVCRSLSAASFGGGRQRIGDVLLDGGMHQLQVWFIIVDLAVFVATTQLHLTVATRFSGRQLCPTRLNLWMFASKFGRSWNITLVLVSDRHKTCRWMQEWGLRHDFVLGACGFRFVVGIK